MPRSRKNKLYVNMTEIPKKPHITPNFPRQPQLYLEFLENTERIKPELVGKEYDPPEVELEFVDDDSEGENIIESDVDERYTRNAREGTDEYYGNGKELYHENLDNEHDEYYDDEVSDNSVLKDRMRQLQSESDIENEIAGSEDYQEIETVKKSKSRHRVDRYSEGSDGSNVSRRRRRRKKKSAPGLKEVEKRHGVKVKKGIQDISKISSSQTVEDMKREYLFKFDMLKKSYPSADIQTFTIHSDLDQMKKIYDSTVRRLSLDSSVDGYKRYLIALFVLIEYVLGSWFSFNMKGYTQQQIVSMSSYERLLIELGEKSYTPGGSRWPVELRLLGMVTINTAMFILAKIIMQKTGSNFLSMFNTEPSPSAQPRKKSKMKGPDINIDDIEDVG